MSDLEEPRALDQQVALALGWEVYVATDGTVCRKLPPDLWVAWEPSVRVENAIEALEATRHEYDIYRDPPCEGRPRHFEVEIHDPLIQDEALICCRESLPAAACGAILAWSKEGGRPNGDQQAEAEATRA